MAVINSYYLYQKYEKRGNQPWIPCYPNTWSVDADGTMPPVLKQQDDPSCYHPIYRWVQTQDTICIDTTTIEYRTTSGDPYCTGYDKYVDTTTEQSFDGGVTWEFVSSSSTLVETDSEYCGYEPTPEVQYRWTESGTTCDNANKYKRYIKEVSYDGGEAWLVVQPPQYSAGTLVEADSYDCGYRTSATTSATYCSNANQYVDVYSLVSRDYGETWSTASTSTELIEEDVVECGFSARTISTATTCVGVDKHYLDEYQESRDTGTTWTTISSSTGSLIESQSTDCGYSATTVSSATYCSNANQYVDVYSIVSTDYGQTWITASTSTVLVDSDVYECGYRTGTTTGTPYCDGYDKYVDVYYRTSRDSGTTWTTASTTPTLVEAQSEDCGYVPPTPTQYRWTQSGTTCIGYDKYQNNIKEQSTDGGETWTVVIPEEYSASTLIEADSQDCGYVPPTPSSPKYTLNLRNGSTVTATCDSTSSITQSEVSNQYSGYSEYSIFSFEIGDCVTSIGDYAFGNCSSLSSITIPNNVTSIGEYAFSNCGGVRNISLSNTLTSIGDYAFGGIQLTTSVIIPNSVTSIGKGAFVNCVRLNTVNIPSGVTTIGENTFSSCPLTSITIPNSVTSIGNSAFTYCQSLPSVTIPDSVTSIGKSVFYGCTSLTSLTIGNNVTSIGSYAFQYCTGLTSVTIPNSVTSIPYWCFISCSGLTNVDLGTSVSQLKGQCFEGCASLTSITIPSSVTSISLYAFRGCTSLTSVTVEATTPPTLSSGAFDNTNNCPIYVPSASVSTYQSAWSAYASRIQAIT